MRIMSPLFTVAMVSLVVGHGRPCQAGKKHARAKNAAKHRFHHIPPIVLSVSFCQFRRAYTRITVLPESRQNSSLQCSMHCIMSDY